MNRVARYLVTGGTGFVGTHLLPRLLERGEVALLLRNPAETGDADARLAAVLGDVSSPEIIQMLPASEVVYHMAAVSYVPDAHADPVKAFEVNVRGTLNMLEYARRSPNLKRFVFISSGHVYGPAQYSPIDERHPLDATNVYGATKLAAERLVKAYHDAYGLPTVVLRTFNVYGPGQSPSFLIPSIVGQLRQGKPPVLGDGRPVRDFTYIDDYVEVLLNVAENEGAVGETFNVGTGNGASVSDVVHRLMKISGVVGEPTFSSAKFREGEIMELVVDNRRLRERTSWQPRVSLDRGLEATWAGSATPRSG